MIKNKKFIVRILILVLSISLLMLAVTYKQSIDNLSKLESETKSRVSAIELIWDTDTREVDLQSLWYYLKFLNKEEIQNYKLTNNKSEILFNNGIEAHESNFNKTINIELKNKGEFVATLTYTINILEIIKSTFLENIFYVLLIGLLTFTIAIVVYLIEYFEHEKTKFLLEQSHKLAAIGQTAAMLAHDVRKPFASVKALLKNINYFVSNPEKLDLAQKDLNKTISGVENMIADIMDFSREQKFDLKETNIKLLIENSISQIENTIDNSKYNINFETTFNHINNPKLEENKIARVFQNIFSNAFEAITIMGSKNTGKIEITTQESDNNFTIIITNDGPKFTKDAIENIFESFYTSGKNSGTGLGLASVKKIIELHGGTIIARNRQDKDGVEFVIAIPN